MTAPDRYRQRGQRHGSGGVALLNGAHRRPAPAAADTDSESDRPAKEVDTADTIVEPLDSELLAGRREVVLANRRARKAAKPAYVNTDASWQDGLAGLAYVGALGARVERVACGDNHEAEYLALLMAMEDADRCLRGHVAFRTDSQTVVNLQPGTAGQFEGVRRRVKGLLASHPEWTLLLVEGKRNRTADELSRRPLKQADASPGKRKARLRASEGTHDCG